VVAPPSGQGNKIAMRIFAQVMENCADGGITCYNITMPRRLLSFLTDIEHALLASEPSPRKGAWQNLRTVNFQGGLARLTLGSADSSAALEPMGAVVLQSYTLADGTLCLKAFLSWSGSQTESVQAIYSRPETDWPAQAKRIAEAWLSGVAAALAERMSHSGSNREPLAVAV